MEVTTPGEFLSEVLADLGTRRSQIRTIEGHEGVQVVRALAPLGETFSYTSALRSATQGRATFSMEFKHYAPIPEGAMKSLVNVA